MAGIEIGEEGFSLALGTVEDKSISKISFCPRLTRGHLVKGRKLCYARSLWIANVSKNLNLDSAVTVDRR